VADNKYAKQFVYAVTGFVNIQTLKRLLNKLLTYQLREFGLETLRRLVLTLQDLSQSNDAGSANTQKIVQSASKKSSKRIQTSNAAHKRFMYASSVAIAAVRSIWNY